MTNTKINSLLIPNVSKLPQHKSVDASNKLPQDGAPSEFQNLLNEQLAPQKQESELLFSTHAARRLQERNLNVDNDEYLKLKGAIDKLKSKGGQDSLVVTSKAAYIIDVPKNTVVTAIDKDSLSENVFTKIDSTLFIN